MMHNPFLNFLTISLLSVALIISGCSESTETSSSKENENMSDEASETLNLEHSDGFKVEYIAD